MGLEKGCPCYTFYEDDLEFKKVMQLESAGLVIYRHRTPVNSDASVSQPEKAFNTEDNVFIIHNTSNRTVSTSNYMSEFEQAISCPRCKYIIRHTKKLLLNVPFIRKKDVIGICDHCRFKKQINERCNKCQVVVEAFLKKQELKQKKRSDSDKQEKVTHILKDAPKAVFRKSKYQLQSETSMRNASFRYKTSTTLHVPRVKDMFEIKKKTEKSKQHLKKGFLRQIDTPKLYKYKSDSEITFFEAKGHREHKEPKKNILFNSAENIAFPESSNETVKLIGLDNKHRHRLDRLRQKLKPKIELSLERLPSTELEEYLQKDDTFRQTDYGTQKLPSVKSDIQEKEKIKKDQHSYDDIQDAKYDQEVSKPSQKEEIFLKGIQKPSRSVHNIRRYSSQETLPRSASATSEAKLQKDFSYVFIKETDVVKKPPRKLTTSSELIKDTQDMYRAKAEEERIKKEQELKENLEAEEKKRLARWKRRIEERRLEELKKKKAEEELKKNRAEEERMQKRAEEERMKKRAEEESMNKRAEEESMKKRAEEEIKLKKNKLSKQDTESQKRSVKSSKAPSEKSKSGKLKTELKDSKIDKSFKSETDSLKSKKELNKQDKESMRLIKKEIKLKEKAEKEELIRKANDDKQRQKEEKEKANKEEQMHLDKEDKQRQKEEKEKEKAKKEEIRKAKEEKQKEKEIKEKQAEQLRMENKQKQREKEERLKAKKKRQKEKEEMRRPKPENENVSKYMKEDSKEELKKQLAEHKKQKELQLRKKQEDEAKKLEAQLKLEKLEAQLKLKSIKEAKAELEPEKSQSKKIPEETKMKELNINQIKVRKNSTDDTILQFVKFKKGRNTVKERPTRKSQIDLRNRTLIEHMRIHKNLRTDSCIICLDSDLELDIDNILWNETKPEEMNDIIIGQKIFKYKPPLVTKREDKGIKPLFFDSTYTEGEGENNIVETQEVNENIKKPVIEKEKKPPKEKEKQPSVLSAISAEEEVPKGIIRYALSDRTFIEKGWTMLPTEKVVRKMNVYRMRPAHPEFDWFEHNKTRKLICYDTGEKLAEFNDNGKGRWFYRNGKVALDYYDAEEINAQQRIVIFSSGEPDQRGCSRPSAILATFDYLGNGIVFDHSGKIRLKYNQTEGIVLDRSIGPVSHWKWHTLNDPPVLQQVMIDTQMTHKDPKILKLGGSHDNKPRPDNEEMLAIEFDNFIKEKCKKLSQKFKPFQIKMKALKINEYFSLKVLDQASIYLIYRDGSTNLKLNIGMILDHQEIVDTDTAEVGEVSNNLERFPARTDSLAGLQRSVAHAQRVERARVERTRRLRPTQPCASADRLVSGLSRPRHAPSRLGSSCQCRKPPTFNLYYDTCLI